MYFQSMHDVLSMEGHGSYVWSAFVFSAIVIFIMLWWPRVRLRKKIEQLNSRIGEV